MSNLIARWIERRLGGYRQAFNKPTPGAPEKLAPEKLAPDGAAPRVAIVGAGLAGLSAASSLASAGFDVTLLERNDYIGGKLGAWKTTLPGGREIGVSHGFHAFFHHYYNLDGFLGEVGVTKHYRNIGDYRILTRDGRELGFANIATTPILNLLSLARAGMYRLRRVARSPTGPMMEALLRYDPVQTYARWDQVSYAEFADRAELPEDLRLIFNTFARVFFADADKMSMAELIKSFHFYYLSNDGGLLFEYLDDDLEPALLAPMRAHLERLGVTLRTGCEVHSLVPRGSDSTTGPTTGPTTGNAPGGYLVDGEAFDYLILACDPGAASRLAQASPELARHAPKAARQLAQLRTGQRYAVLRVWFDRDHGPRELPPFVITERLHILDAIVTNHRSEAESKAWAEERRAEGLDAGIYELHCYAVPDDFSDDEDEMTRALLEEVLHFLPGLRGAEVLHTHLSYLQDFPAFHVGQHSQRPQVTTERPDLFLAGDWVTLPMPAMLMEAACVAGFLAANSIREAHGLRPRQLWSVPARGIMADLPRRPGS